jgi:OmcA/MtrC family decaheme c-type cytochrome
MVKLFTTTRWAATVAAIVLTLSACGGGSGPAGPQGPTGATGPTGASGQTGPQGPAGSGAVNVGSNAAPASEAAQAAWVALQPKVTVTGVTIASPPVVDFTVTTQGGAPVVGLGNTSQSSSAAVPSLTNLAFAMAKLVPAANGSPSRWVSYIVTSVPTRTTAAAPSRPGTDNTGTLVDHGDGSYTYTFYRDITTIKAQVDAMTVSGANNKADLDDLSYQSALTHRLTIQLSGNAPGTGNNTPTGAQVAGAPGVPLTNAVDAIYDFIPATGAPVASSGRDIVATAKCEECHRKLGGIPGDDPESSAAGFHGGARNETRYCVVCHTEQRKYGRTEATYDPATLTFTGATNKVDGRALGNLPNHVHHIHAGAHLAKKNYDYGGLAYNEVLFPQDLRNCTKCHDGSDTSTAKTDQGDNWKNVPNRLACGGCHDGINFDTGAGVTLADAAAGATSTVGTNGLAHGGGAQLDDSKCRQCHTPTGIDVAHTPVTAPDEGSVLHVAGGDANTNSAWIASNTSRLPAGAIKVSYDIKSVARDANRNPVMVFRLLRDGARHDLNDFATTTPSAATGDKELWDDFMGAPSVQFVFAMPQDGVSQPADFNGSASSWLKGIWNGTATGTSAGTLTGPDADGYYTVTLTAATIPDEAVMLTGGLGFSYNVQRTLPLTQTNLPAYPVLPSPVGQANEIGGLVVVVPNATKVATGHTGRRQIVEDARCNKCHQELGTFTTEAFHGGQRNDATTCSWCHTPNRTSAGWSADSTSYIHAIHGGAKRSVPFNWHAASADEGFFDVKFPGVLKECETCHLPGSYYFYQQNNTPLPDSVRESRLFRTVATNTLASTGATFTYSPYITQDLAYGSGYSFNVATGVVAEAADTTLVTSPVATACVACHDSNLSRAHMIANGASLYAPRSTALGTTETCLVCHDRGRIADIKVMHAK